MAEVTNTPWKERHQYVLAVTDDNARPKRFEFAKDFHVSPFLPMDMLYQWRFSIPGERLHVNMQNSKNGRLQFDATLSLKLKPLSARSLLAVLGAFPFMTLQVIAAIHWQALKLWVKGTPFYSHPRYVKLNGTES